jgi:CubicO group peptidase (beta-lactamase class C family)
VATHKGQPSDKQAGGDLIFSAFNTHTPGCSVGVDQNGIVVLKGGYGMADLERNVPVTPDTIFESGSVAKQFRAAVVSPLAPAGICAWCRRARSFLVEQGADPRRGFFIG